VDEVREALIDPPPKDNLTQQVRGIARTLRGGATWEIIESKARKTAAVVLYKSRYPDGTVVVQPALLLNRYDRWKLVLGALNPKRLTPVEREDVRLVTDWAANRLKEFQAATRPAGAGASTGAGATTQPAPNPPAAK
jgi:hypothetical protein